MPIYGSTGSTRRRWPSSISGGGAGSDDYAAERRTSTTLQVSGPMAVEQYEANKDAALEGLRRLEQQGITSGDEYNRLSSIARTGAPPSGNWFTRALSWLDRPGQLVRYGIADIFDIGEGEKITGQAYADILMGRGPSLVQRYGEEVVGDDARMSGSQLLKLRGYDEATTGWGKFVRGLASFGTEIVTDPLSYVTLGGAGAARSTLQAGVRSVARNAAEEGAEMVARGATREVLERALEQGGRHAAAQRAALEVIDSLPVARSQMLAEAVGAVARNDETRRLMTQAPHMFFTPTRLAEVEKLSLPRATQLASDALVNRWAPRAMARDWAAREVADMVTYHATPAYLRGGLRVSPLPMLWQKGEHALAVPGTRGLGKKVSRTLFGKGSVLGQKPTGLRGMLERGMPGWFRGAEQMGIAMDRRAWNRSVIRGTMPATLAHEVETLFRTTANTVGSGPMLDQVRASYINLVRAGERAGMSEQASWELLNRSAMRALERTDLTEASAQIAAEALVRNAGFTDPALTAAYKDFLVGARRVLTVTGEAARRVGMIPAEAARPDYVPLVVLDELGRVLDDLAEQAVEIPLDSVGGQHLAMLVAARRLRRVTAPAVGEAVHAQPREFGVTSISPVGSTGRTYTADTETLVAEALGDPRWAALLQTRLGVETLDAGGVPFYELVSTLDEQMTEALERVLAANPQVVRPKLPKGVRMTVFAENPLVVFDNYLLDMHSAIVERTVVRHMLSDPRVMERVTPRLQAELTKARIAQEFSGKSEELISQIAGRAAAVARGDMKELSRASRLKSITGGGITVEVHEHALTPRLERALRRDLERVAEIARGSADLFRRREALVARYVARGVSPMTAEALVDGEMVAPTLAIMGQLVREGEESARREVRVLLEAARSDADTIAAKRWLDDQVREISRSQSKASRVVSQRLRPKPLRMTLAVADAGAVVEAAADTARQLQITSRTVTDRRLHALLEDATALGMGGEWAPAATRLREIRGIPRLSGQDRASLVAAVEAAYAQVRQISPPGVAFAGPRRDEVLKVEKGLRDLLLSFGLPDVDVVLHSSLSYSMGRLSPWGVDALGNLDEAADMFELAALASHMVDATRRTSPLEPPTLDLAAVGRAYRRLLGYPSDTPVAWANRTLRNRAGHQFKVLTPTINVAPPAMLISEVRRRLSKVGIPLREARRMTLEAGQGSTLPADFVIPTVVDDGVTMYAMRGAVADTAGHLVPVWDGRYIEGTAGTLGSHAVAAGRLEMATGHDMAARLLPNASADASEMTLLREGGVAINALDPRGVAYVRLTRAEWNRMMADRPAQAATVVDFLQRAKIVSVRLDAAGGYGDEVVPLTGLLPSGWQGRVNIDHLIPPDAQAVLVQLDDAAVDAAATMLESMDEMARLERLAAGELPVVDSVVQPAMFEATSKRQAFDIMFGEAKITPAGGRRIARVGQGVAAIGPARRQLAQFREIAEKGGARVGDLIPEVAEDRWARSRLFLAEDGRTGFAVTDDGELHSLFNVGESHAGQAAIVRARMEGAERVLVPRDDLIPLFEKYGFRVTRRNADGGAIMHLLPADLKAAQKVAAKHQKAAHTLEQVLPLLERGGVHLDEAEVLLRKNRALLRSVDPARYDELHRRLVAAQALRDPQLRSDLKQLIRDRAAHAPKERTSAEIQQRLDNTKRELAHTALRLADEGSEGVEAVAIAATLLDKVQQVMRRLDGLPLRGLDEEAEIRVLMGECREHMTQLGYKKMADAFVPAQTLIPPKGKTLIRAYSLGGTELEMVAGIPGVNQFLESMVGQMRALNTPLGLQFLGHQVRSVVNWWKGMATVARPTFHVRNLIGGVWNNQIGGVRVRDYVWVRDKALRIRHAMADGLTLPEAIAKLPNPKDRDVFMDAFEQGLLQSSFARADLRTFLRPPTGAQRFNPLSAQGPLVQAGGVVMESIEDFLRMAAFKRWHDHGADVAYEWAIALHFDYKNLTPLETKIKNFIPFFVWTRNNLPLQLRALVERPDLIQRYQHLMYGFNDQASDDSPYDMPFSASNVLQIGTDMVFNEGTPFWARAIISPDLPLTDLAEIDQLYNPLSWVKYLAGSLGPQVNLPVELARQSEIGGWVNAPAGINEILVGLHALGLYGAVSQNEGETVARVPRPVRAAIETLVPPLREYLGPFDTDPSRRQSLGLPSGQEAAPTAAERARAYGIWLGRGVGMRTQTPTQAYSRAYQVSEEIRGLLGELEKRGVIPLQNR